jgi:mono/diheme cytochrome c family protein
MGVRLFGSRPFYLPLAIGFATLAPLAMVAAAAPRPARPAPPRRPANPRNPAGPTVDYNREVRPILAKSCFSCHGPDEGHRVANLRLDRADGALAPRAGGAAAIAPGAPERSLMIRRVTAADGAGRMPPPATGHRLTPAQVATLRAWIRQGGRYAPHWAFVAPVRPRVPAVRNPAWIRNPIDAFILAELERGGLKPAAEADRFALLRRASLDLRGLPPSPAEVEAFARDTSPEAYEKAIDRFLDDSAYGERWARLWLDLARYADSAGHGSDPLRTIWGYRDWVIDAFNRNLPYDEFTIQQLAGDLLPNPTPDQKIATAFHRNTMTNTEGGTDDEEFRLAAVRDRVDTTMQVWMGLTAGCAKCHSHKYDPITQKEYYQLVAFFNQTADADRPDEAPVLELPAPELETQRREIDEKIAGLKKQLEPPPADAEAAKKLREEVDRLEKSRPRLPSVPVMSELPADQRRETHLLVKGNYLDPGDRVETGVPAAFHPLAEDAPSNRLGVARWLLDPRNPLTARVAVNRFWAQLFGTGLVETEEDWGTQGEPPSHPQLLDWLAVTFREGTWATGKPERRPWDMKAVLRLIVTSATYRQSSRVTPAALAKDPRNRLLSRAPRYRLEAEILRDQALALSGLLSRKMHGPSVFPPQPDGLWQAAFNGERTWATSKGEDRYRRGLYTFWRRTVPYPAMATFDAPSREFCVVRRIRTNTPLQAFVTLNDPCFVEAAQALARRLVREGGATPEERARYAVRLCLCRPPTDAQVKEIVALYETEREHYRRDPQAALALATEPLGPLPDGMDAGDLAAWTVVANVVLNMDGVLTRS